MTGDNQPKNIDTKKQTEGGQKNQFVKIPSITLPKGGGALKNIDEKFQVNSANGSASFFIPLSFSKTRSNFGPAFSLSYNSGSGNGVFGLGWDIGLSSIQRKTDKKLPEYKDGEESDVFMFTGVEDLVPSLKFENNNWIEFVDKINGIEIKRYRPRIEGEFHRIERITLPNTNTFYWRVTTKENIVTIYGRLDATRIANPDDNSQIFKWLPELSYDDKGNCFEIEYAEENLEQVTNALYEQNRFNKNSNFTNSYVKRIKYGNKNPYFPDQNLPYNPPSPENPEYLFEAVFDYGDHAIDNPEPIRQKDWPCRIEPFSDYKPGFEIRTYRLCRRILFFHYFKELNDNINRAPCLVRSIDLSYKYFDFEKNPPKDETRNVEVDYIISLQHCGYKKNGDGYSKKCLPPEEFTYQEFAWDKEALEIKDVSPEIIAHAPEGISNRYQWVDLWSEGISGILTEQSDGWYYKSNKGEPPNKPGSARFSPAQLVVPKPSLSGLSNNTLQLSDIEADGRKFIVSTQGALKGYFEITGENEWKPFAPFDQMPNINFNDPSVKFIDLTGDGKPDLIISEESVFTWYANKGISGYDSAEISAKTYDEEKGPAIVFADQAQSIFLADMSGDGMIDIVRIRNGEICYWPNLGYGRFGAKVNMDNAPLFDLQDQFNPFYLHLSDISGTGATDILYLGKNQFSAWFNLSGNAWSETKTIDPFPTTESPNQLSVLDFLANGTSCIVWSSPLPQYANTPMRYIDLMRGKKPYVMTAYKNNFGKEVTWDYKSSTFYFLQDKENGTPWITKLPFPVQCVSEVTIKDLPAETQFKSIYNYHHGYYDYPEREYRGFGKVEQLDSETFEAFKLTEAKNVVQEDLHQSPVKTVTWFHTGAYFNEEKILDQFEKEYNKGPFEFDLPKPILPDDLTPEETREALRACKGITLRQEIYATDGSVDEDKPYSVSIHNCIIKLLQPKQKNKHAVFYVHEGEALDIHYERNLYDPRIAHTLNLEVDKVGNVLKSASVVYGRKADNIELPEEICKEQKSAHVIITQNDFTKNPDNPDNDFYFDNATVYRGKLLAKTKIYELTNTEYKDVNQFNIRDLKANFEDALPVNYEDPPTGSLQKRLIEDIEHIYLKDDLVTPMELGHMDALAFPYQSYQLALTSTLINSHYNHEQTRVADQMLLDAKYVHLDDTNWWIQSGRLVYLNSGETAVDARKRFFTPIAIKDAYEILTKLAYDDPYFLTVIQTEDALYNKNTAVEIDYRTLQPTILKDLNDNYSEILTDELGMVVATSVYGDEGDGMHGEESLSTYNILEPADLSEVIQDPHKFLQKASTYFYYDLFAWERDSQPVCFANVVRETHESEVKENDQTKVFLSVGYSSGLGHELQTKVQAEPGKTFNWKNGERIEVDTTPNLRWVGSGRTILNNKGNPVKQYEPYFSTTYKYESEKGLVEIGFSSVIYYDPLDRKIKVVHPNGTFAKTEFDAWKQLSFDENDTVINSEWYNKRIVHQDPLIATPEEVEAAKKTLSHYNTPSQAHLDSLGRTIYTIADNGADKKYPTRIILDIENNEREIYDARNNRVMEYRYDMLSRKVYQKGMDKGERWLFYDIMNQPAYAWDSRKHSIRNEYDDLHRPTNHWLIEDVVNRSTEKLIGVTIYGETQDNDAKFNLRGKAFQSYDQSGLVQNSEYDFKGNVKRSFKQLAVNYKNVVDWNVADGAVLLETEMFNSALLFDATNKAIEMELQDGSKIFPVYNEANLLDQLDVFVQSQNKRIPFVTNIDYNAKAQRIKIQYGNNTVTEYKYDERMYRLTELRTMRNTGSESLQDLKYTYDPVGNITEIKDAAQQTCFFNNQQVDPSSKYAYDAIYRLTCAAGREQAGKNAPCDQFDNDKTKNENGSPLTLPGDMSAMQRYEQVYEYDEVGNMLKMIHNAGNGIFTNKWTRTFEYNNDDKARSDNNILPTAYNNNQLLNEYTGERKPTPRPKYSYDQHGNMLNLQRESFNMIWNYADQLQQVNLGGGGIAYYVYDSMGQRVRKVIETNGNLIKERIYLGSYELYRELRNGDLDLQRESIHLMDDKQRIALIEIRTTGTDKGFPFLIRYQYSNHLASTILEMSGDKDNPEIISYEEYYPFGSTAYQAMRSKTETPKVTGILEKNGMKKVVCIITGIDIMHVGWDDG